MRINKLIRHTDRRCRSPIYRGTDIYGAWGWGKTHMNFLISIIAPSADYELSQPTSVQCCHPERSEGLRASAHSLSMTGPTLNIKIQYRPSVAVPQSSVKR